MLNFEENISVSIPAGSTLGGIGNAEAVARIKKIAEYVLADHPEIFWYGNSIVLSGTSMHITQYSRTLLFDSSLIPSYKTAIEAKALEMLNSIRGAEGDYEITKALYKYITQNTIYDLNTDYQHTIYAVMINGRGVCDGYTKTFQYILNYCGVENIFVWGYSGGGAHAWCLVKNEGSWYQTDVTWGDPSISLAESVKNSYFTYAYLNLTSQEMYQNHTIASYANIPEADKNSVVEMYIIPGCTATSCNYFVKEGLLFDSYDFDAVADAVVGEINKLPDTAPFALAEVRFSNDDAWYAFSDPAGFKVTRALGNAGIINYTQVTYSTNSEFRSRVFILIR